MAPIRAVRLRLGALLLCVLAAAGCENPATPPPAVASVIVESPTASLMVGDTARLTAEVRDASGGAISGRAVSWSSSGDAVVTVNARGTVTAVGPGTATVTATVEGKSDSVELTVTPVPGTLVVSVETAGELPDPDGYVVVIDGAERGAIGIDGRMQVSELAPGEYAVQIQGRAFNCVPDEEVHRVRVNPGSTAEALVRIHCGRNAVAFISLNHDRYRLLLAVPGGGLRQIADSVYFNAPQWTPDGRRVVFTAQRPGKGIRIYTVDPDGDGPVELPLAADGDALQPHLSPDGTRIAYLFDPWRGPAGLRVARVDGTDDRALIPVDPLSPTTDLYPSWSPDGSWIAFARWGSPATIQVVREDGSALRPLVDVTTFTYRRLAWSPDGAAVIYSDGPYPAAQDLHSVSVSTGLVTPLMSTLTLAEKHPVLRRDGRIVFEVVDSEGSGPLPLHSIRPDGTDPQTHPIDFPVYVWLSAWQ